MLAEKAERNLEEKFKRSEDKMKRKRKMTERQARFVDGYIATGNAAHAARKAGYSERSARSIGEENLTKPYISEAIKDRLEELASERIATEQEALERVTAVMRGETKEFVVTPSGKKIEVPARVNDRLRAAELILKVNGSFREKVELKMGTSEWFASELEKIWTNETNH